MSSAAGVTSGGPLRNIIIGVITTVLGSGAVYYLGFHKSDNPAENLLLMKEATVNGWNSYVSAENVFFSNVNTLNNQYTNERFDHYKQATLDEVNRFKEDLKKILASKDIDPSLSSLLERRLQAKQQWEEKYKSYLDKYQEILQTIGNDQTQKLNLERTKFQTEVKDLDDRFANEIGNICQTLTSKYGYNFSWTTLFMYQNNQTAKNNEEQKTNTVERQMLVGKWKVVNDYLDQNADGSFNLNQGGNNFSGTWTLYNDLLYHYYAGNNTPRVYRIINHNDQSFTAESTDSTHYTFVATRTNQ